MKNHWLKQRKSKQSARRVFYIDVPPAFDVQDFIKRLKDKFKQKA